VLLQYERVGGFASSAASEAVEMAPEETAAGTESVADAFVPPPTSEGQEASLHQPAEAAETTASAAAIGAAEGVVGEAGSSLSRPVAAGADEVRVPDEPIAALQERVAPEDTARAASPEIQEAEEAARPALVQGATSSEARALELACTLWAATPGSGHDTEDDEEVVTRNTLDRRLNWARRAFDELILPATLVSLLV
jgi:hypothetical protein